MKQSFTKSSTKVYRNERNGKGGVRLGSPKVVIEDELETKRTEGTGKKSVVSILVENL